jgi:hypothetical protein
MGRKRYSMPAPRLEGRTWEDIRAKLQQWIEVATSILDLQSEALDLDLEGKDILNVGGIYVTVRTTAGAIVITGDDNIIIAKSAGAIGLPKANQSKGRQIRVKNASAGVVSLVPVSGELVDDAASFDLLLPYESAAVVSDGASWWVI